MSLISINISHGNSEVTEEDRDRAKTAALECLRNRGTTPEAAYEELKRQWAWLETDEAQAQGKSQDYTDLTGLAAIWVEAERAADIALTLGWANPDGASCFISA